MSDYVKSCNFCKQQIRMNERLGRWYPSDLDGGVHHCSGDAKKEAVAKQPEVKQQQPLTLDQIDVRLKRVERMLFNQGK